MKNLMLLICALLITSLNLNGQTIEEQIGQAEKQLAKQLIAKGINTVGVADFTYMETPNTHLGKYLADELNNAIFMSGNGLSVIDRNTVREALYGNGGNQKAPDRNVGILKRQLMGKVSSMTGIGGSELGAATGLASKVFKSKKLGNADAIVFGNIVDLGEELKLTIQVVKNHKKSEIMAMSSVRLPKSEDLALLIER